MSKIKILILSLLFITLCLWLGFYGEVYATESLTLTIPNVVTNLDIGNYLLLNDNTLDLSTFDYCLVCYPDADNSSSEMTIHLSSHYYSFTDDSFYQFDTDISFIYDLTQHDFTYGPWIENDYLLGYNTDSYYYSNSDIYDGSTFVNPNFLNNCELNTSLLSYSDSSSGGNEVGNNVGGGGNEVGNNVGNNVGGNEVGNNVGNNVGGNEDNNNSNIFQAISEFFDNFWDNLLHIVVPNSEDFEDLQESFEDNVLSVFTITKLSRFSDYSNNYGPFYDGKFPIINILGYNFNTEQFYTLLNTPISFGVLNYQTDETSHPVEVNTGGLTAYTIINIFIAIDIAFLNIFLFNKFFDKGD